MKVFDICGFQFEPDEGVDINNFIMASRILNCDKFVVWNVEANNAIAYCLVNVELDDNLGVVDREELENFIREILDDVNKETPNGEYVWNNGNGDVNIKLVYA